MSNTVDGRICRHFLFYFNSLAFSLIRSKTPAMARPHVRAMYAALGDHVYVIGGAKSCREVEKLDVSVDAEKWTLCAVSSSLHSPGFLSPSIISYYTKHVFSLFPVP